MLRVGDIRFKAPGHGEVTPPTVFQFLRGNSYPITLVHLSTNLSEGPDYDYTAHVTPELGSCANVDDPQNLLGVVYNDNPAPNENSAAYKEATLLLPKIDLDMDANRDGQVDQEDTGPDDTDEEVWAYGSTATGAIIVCNNDDDNADGAVDSVNDLVDGANDVSDLTPLVIRRLGSDLPTGWTVKLSVVQSGDKVRIFDARNATATAVITPGMPPHEYEIPLDDIIEQGVPLEYGIEAIEYSGWPTTAFDGLVTLSLSLLDDQGAVQCQDTLQARVAPWLMPSHLDTVNEVYVTTWSPQFVADLQAALAGLAAIITQINAPGDAWPQDQFEIGFHSAPGYGINHVVLEMPRNAYDPGLGDYSEDELLGAGVGYVEIPGIANGDNFGGNLEAIGPDAQHLFGRIYFGNNMDNALRTLFGAQQVQAPPLNITVDWLAIGHIDEIMTLVPGSTNRVLLADAQAGVDLLQNADPAHVFDDGQLVEAENVIIDTVFDLLTEFAIYNIQDVQPHLVAIRNQLEQAGVTVVSVPAFFVEDPVFNTAVFPGAYSALPNVLNSLVVNGRIIMPDPMWDPPASVNDPNLDPLKTAVLTAIPGADIRWIDTRAYHLLGGEVHCGTNCQRAINETDERWWLVEPSTQP